MASGRYFCFERKDELDTTVIFTYVLQVWLSIFGFSLAGLIASITVIRWSIMDDSYFNYIAGGLAALFVGGLAIVVLYSLWRVIKLFYFGFRGQIIRFNSKTPDNILKATRPLKNSADLEEYKKILQNKIDENNKLIKEYYDLIKQLDSDGDKITPKGGQKISK